MVWNIGDRFSLSGLGVKVENGLFEVCSINTLNAYPYILYLRVGKDGLATSKRDARSIRGHSAPTLDRYASLGHLIRQPVRS